MSKKSWPTHDNGKPKQIREMNQDELHKLARELFDDEFGSDVSKYLDSFDPAFERIFGTSK